MGLLRYAVALGVGYALARPEARRKVAELAHHPAVTNLRARGQDAAAGGLQSARHRLGRSESADTGAADTSALQNGVLPPATGFGGTTLEEGSQAAARGLPPLPRTAPPITP